MRYTMYDFYESTDTLKFWTEKWAINKTFCFSSNFDEKLGEIVEHMGNYNITNFHQNQLNNKFFY